MEKRRERMEITLCGGKPWGFSIKGGTDTNKSIIVSKLENRGKGEASGLRIGDIIICVNHVMLGGIRREAVELIKRAGDRLILEVERGFQQHMINPPSQSRASHFENINPGSRMPLVQRYQDEEIFDFHQNANNMNTSYNNNQQPNREYNNRNQNHHTPPRGYIFSEKSNRMPATTTYQQYEKDTQSKTAFANKIDQDHHQNKSSKSSSPSPQKLAEQDRRGIASRRSVESMTNSNERLGNDEPVPPPRQVAMRRRQQQNKNQERPRSWHASKHPEVEQELRSYIEKSTSQKMTKRKSKGWMETEDLKSTLEGDSTESLTGREERSYTENKESQGPPSNKFRGSCPDTMNYDELVNYRSNPVSLSRSSLDTSTKSINTRTDRESLSSESSCSMRIEGSVGNKLRSSGRYGEIWKLPQTQDHRRARSFDALSEEPSNNHSSRSSKEKRSSLRKSTGSTGSESSPHIHQEPTSKTTSPSKSKSSYNSERQSDKSHFRVSQHFNLDKGELSISDTSSSSLEQVTPNQFVAGNGPKQPPPTSPGGVNITYQSNSMVVQLLRNPTTTSPSAGDFSIIQTKRPKSASSKLQPHISRTSLSSMDDYENADDKNMEENNTIMSNNDEYKKNIQGMSKKVLRVTSFTRPEFQMSPPYQQRPLQPVKQEFSFPAVTVEKSILPNAGSGPVRSKSTSSLLEKPVMSTVAIPITPDKTQYCESVSASQSRPHDSPRIIRQSNPKKTDDSDSWWIKHTKDSRSNSLQRGAALRYEDRQQNDRDIAKRLHGSTSPNFARSPPKEKTSIPSSNDKYKNLSSRTSPPSHDIKKSRTSSTELRDQDLQKRSEDKVAVKSPMIKTSPPSRETSKSRKLSETHVTQSNKPSANFPDRDHQYKSSSPKVSTTKADVPKSNRNFTSKGIIPSNDIASTTKNSGRYYKRSNFDTPQPFHDVPKTKTYNESATVNLKPPSNRSYNSPIHKVSPPSPKASHSREGSGENTRSDRLSPKLGTKVSATATAPISPPLKMETSPSSVTDYKNETDDTTTISNSITTSPVRKEIRVSSSETHFANETNVPEPSSDIRDVPLSPVRDTPQSTHGHRPRLSDSLTMLPVDHEDVTTAVKVSLAKEEMLPTQKEVEEDVSSMTDATTNLPKDMDSNTEVPVFDEDPSQPITQQNVQPEKQTMTTITSTTNTTTITSTTDTSLRNTVLTTPALTNLSKYFMSRTSTLPPSSAYYQTSASKGKIINIIQEKVEGGEIVVSETDDLTGDDINDKKVELLTSITHTLSALQKNKDLIKIDIAENEQLGKVVRQNAEQLCTPREHEKFKTFVEEVDKIFNLLLSIGGRLARVENALATLDPEANAEEKNGLLEKRRKLTLQHEEAQLLKENVDRRQKLVSEILHSHMSEEQYADFEHYIRMKTNLISEQRDLDDKMKLGEEQLRELYDSLPESLQESLPLSLQYQANASPGATTNEQSNNANRTT